MKYIDNLVLFWGKKDCFSNWYPSSFTYEGVMYSCSEQFMMRAKALTFYDTITARKVMETKNPHTQKVLGRQVTDFDAEVWGEVARDLMVPALVEKFSQNSDILRIILGTGSLHIVEASPVDFIWGVGLHEDDPLILDPANWRGSNWLGDVLMKARSRLQAMYE